jgi:hypothetical protein
LGEISGMRKKMASIPQAKPKREIPNEPPEWFMQQVWLDMQELKDEWCRKIDVRTTIQGWAIGAMASVLLVTALVVFELHPQDIADGLAKFFGVQ